MVVIVNFGGFGDDDGWLAMIVIFGDFGDDGLLATTVNLGDFGGDGRGDDVRSTMIFRDAPVSQDESMEMVIIGIDTL